MTQKDYKALVKKANEARRAYYLLSAPIMSDKEYDVLERMIEKFEFDHPGMVDPNSPTQTVGAAYGGGKKVGYACPMLSVKKTYEVPVGDTFDCECTVEWKWDGISCSIVYVDGDLVQAGTRGDGMVGMNITDVVMGIPSVPKRIGVGGRVEVRGEVVMTEDVYNACFDSVYPDGRNAASTLAQSGHTENGQYLTFKAWQGMGDAFRGLGKHSERMGALRRMGFDAECKVVRGLAGIKAEIERMEAVCEEQEVYVDGIVVKVNDISQWVKLGNTKTSPRWAIAYKWDSIKVAVKVEHIEIRTADSGRVTPIVWFTPIMIGCIKYDHVSGGSMKTIAERGVKVGGTCVVELRGGTSLILSKAEVPTSGGADAEECGIIDATGTVTDTNADEPICEKNITGFLEILLAVCVALGKVAYFVVLVCAALLCAIVGVKTPMPSLN